MARVVVIGNSGGGKSTLARRIAEVRTLPLTEVDSLLWRPGWNLAPRAEYDAAHREAIECDEWVIEGLGRRDTISERLRRATEIVLIDMPLEVHLRLAADRHVQWKAGTLTHPPAGSPEPPPLEALLATIREVEQSWMPEIREWVLEAKAYGVAVTRLTSLSALSEFACQLAGADSTKRIAHPKENAVGDAIPPDHPIVGAWRLVSFTERDLQTGAVAHPLGERAKAAVIYTASGHVVTLFTAEDRRPPLAPQVTDQEAVALYRSMVAFAGRYELQGSKLIYRPEISWNEAWNGTVQERLFEVSPSRLEVNSVPAVSTLTGRTTVFSLVWERAP